MATVLGLERVDFLIDQKDLKSLDIPLVSIHKWSFSRWHSFSAGFRLRCTTCTPHRKPLCGLSQRKKSSFMNWTLKHVISYREWTLFRLANPA